MCKFEYSNALSRNVQLDLIIIKTIKTQKVQISRYLINSTTFNAESTGYL